MPTRQLRKFEPPCSHPDHNPKKEGLEPGEYLHTCEGCGVEQRFEIPLDPWAELKKRLEEQQKTIPQPWVPTYPPIQPYVPYPWERGTPIGPYDLTPRIWCSVPLSTSRM